MKNFLFTLLTLSVLFSSQSCGKDTDEFIPVSTKIDTIQTANKDTDWQDLFKISNVPTSVLPPLSVEKLMADLAADPTRHDLSAERGGTIVTPDNVRVEFPANSCVTKNNRPCTGNLSVEILVLRKKGEFLLNNIPTISSGKQLISGGAVLVKIKQNGEEVKLARNVSYKVKYQPATAVEEGMKLFEGKFEGRFQFDWSLISPTTNTTNASAVRIWTDTAQGRRITGYELLIDRFNWINCDRFSGDSTFLTNKFCVALPDTFTNQNCSVFAVFKDINSVISLIGDGKVKQFCVPSGYKGVPIGRVINIIAIATIKDRIYISKKEVTISANALIRVEPVLTTKAALKELISNL
ncbi:MAG: hypothetical protein U5L45_26480 [Saprospiraceae bacterium]|nr:hypothetical protein [Saprospiraceae bacterium]